MTAAELVQIVFFAAVALAASWFTWRSPMGMVGLTMLGCTLITSFTYYSIGDTGRSVTVLQAVLELVMAALIVNAARLASVLKPSRALSIIVALAVADIAFVCSLAWGWINPRWLPFVYGAVTQAIFTLQCLMVTAPRIRDGLVAGYRSWNAHRDLGGSYSARDAVRTWPIDGTSDWPERYR